MTPSNRLTISEVAREVGLQPSAIRYYEQIGILMPAQRVSGQRRYDANAVYRLTVIQLARKAGFNLKEIRQLFVGFRNGTQASERWRKLSERKLAELDALMDQIKIMQQVLRSLETNCHCDTIEECGKRIFTKKNAKNTK